MRWISDSALGRLREIVDGPDLTGTKYRRVELLSRGGMGAVWLAEDVELGREVALKVISDPEPSEEGRLRLEQEARILARLEHPGIVPVHDVGRLPDGRVFYAMKRVRGRRLDEVRSDGLSIEQAVRLLERICEPIGFAHSRGVIHRDLKPENVMVGEFGEVLVLDWGVALLHDGSRSTPAAPEAAHSVDLSVDASVDADRGTSLDARLTQPGTILGTPAWMAPEQTRGAEHEIGPHTDVYGLGGVLYFLLTGQAPGAPNADPRTHRKDLPKSLAAVCRKALAAQPSARYASAAALGADLDAFLLRARVSAHREDWIERAGRFFERYQTAILLVFAYLAIRMALLLWTRF